MVITLRIMTIMIIMIEKKPGVGKEIWASLSFSFSKKLPAEKKNVSGVKKRKKERN